MTSLLILVTCRAHFTYQKGGGQREVACRCCWQPGRAVLQLQECGKYARVSNRYLLLGTIKDHSWFTTCKCFGSPGPAKWRSKCIWDHAFQHDGFIWPCSVGCGGSTFYSHYLPNLLDIFLCSKMPFHIKLHPLAESIYLSTLSQSHQRTIRLLHVWSELH